MRTSTGKLRKKVCGEDETVRARKLDYLFQFYDLKGHIDLQAESKSANFWHSVVSNLHNMDVCGHDSRKHRSKFMCYDCYVTLGNQKKATKCKHSNRPHHSRGLCQSCYQKIYYKLVTDPQANEDQIK